MNSKIGSERRLFPRLIQTLPLKIEANGYDFSTISHNVSVAGTYCTIPKYVPPFTKLAIRMTLPMKERVSPKALEVELKGVIVRTEDAPEGKFNIAVFFNEVSVSQRQKIEQYVNQFLPK